MRSCRQVISPCTGPFDVEITTGGATSYQMKAPLWLPSPRLRRWTADILLAAAGVTRQRPRAPPCGLPCQARGHATAAPFVLVRRKGGC